MRALTTGLMVPLTISLLAATAAAQDTPTVGLSMGYPAAIGLVWHVTDRVALRPEIGITRSTNEFIGSSTTFSSGGVAVTTTTTTTTDAWQVSAGVSGLFYLSKHDALRTYLSPRWAYTRQSSSPSSTNGAPTSVVTGTSGRVNVVSGSFGAQYAISDRFSAFGEVGLAFTRTVSSPVVNGSSLTIGDVTSTNAGTRSGAGVILYF
jgi:hypothetical protein